MSVKLQSTKAKLRDPEKVREILADYELSGVEIKVRKGGDGGTLKMVFEEGDLDWWEWPLALYRNQWPDKERYPDPEEGEEDGLEEDEWDKRFGERGAEGFLALLRELAAHLETPLLILVLMREGHDCWAQTWCVQPGTEDAETVAVSF